MNPYYYFTDDDQEYIDAMQMQAEQEAEAERIAEDEKKKRKAKRKAANPKRGFRCSTRKNLPF